MFVYIAHAEADQAAADDLKAFLKGRGLVAESETGARGFRHLQKSDVVIGLWSQKAVFGQHKMMMEKRLFDAWADERLVIVKLDHGFLPVGLRDLPAIDASFESARQMSVWPQVERAAREAMNAALVAGQQEAPPQSPGSGGLLPPEREEDRAVADGFAAATSRSNGPRGSVWMEAPEMAARRGGSLIGSLLAVAGIAALGAGIWTLANGAQGVLEVPMPTAALGIEIPQIEIPILALAVAGVAFGGLVVLVMGLAIAAASGRRKVSRTRRQTATVSAKRASRAAPAVRASSAPSPASEPPDRSVFISYAHADNGAVEPVVKFVEASGRKVWIDKGGIQAGEGWAGEIVRGIKGAQRVIVMCSPKAFESDHIKREVYLADRYKKPMLPVFIAEATPPEDFEYFFAGVQWLELFKLPEGDRPAAIGKALSAT
jgi:hypothetical protein